jgi:dCMP deaminase
MPDTQNHQIAILDSRKLDDQQRRWDLHFMALAMLNAQMSKDPDTKVGAVIVDADRNPVSQGWNGFARGVADTHERLHDNQLKNMLMVHAEENAFNNASQRGVRTKDCVLYYVATDDTNNMWGGPPCIGCTNHCIQNRISRVISFAPKTKSRWHENLKIATELLQESGIPHRIIEKPRIDEAWPWPRGW